MKTLKPRKPTKSEREMSVLLGLVDLYLSLKAPIGSNTLKDNGFEDLSSATIRNYFVKLEAQDYLSQPHASGGRVPTAKAFRVYAERIMKKNLNKKMVDFPEDHKKEIDQYLHEVGEILSENASLPIFLSKPIFDMDFIQEVKLIRLDKQRILSVLITDFGQIRTEVLFFPDEFDDEALSLVQDYFYWRMSKGQKPEFDTESLHKWAVKLYREIMVRHVVSSSQNQTEIFKTGLCKLLDYPEFQDASLLANCLAIFENQETMQKLLRCGMQNQGLTYLISEDLLAYAPRSEHLTVVAIPYYINQIKAGAIAILGPMSLAYKEIFPLLKQFSEDISEVLTQNVYKFKISFKPADSLREDYNLDQKSSILLENKS